MAGIDQYFMFCIFWTFVALCVQVMMPAYAKQTTWKNLLVCGFLNYIFAPICYVFGVLRIMTDLFILLAHEHKLISDEDRGRYNPYYIRS